MRIGTIAGFLLTAASIPFLSSKGEGNKAEKNIPSLISEQDKKEIEMLMSKSGFKDLRLQETKWVEKVYPTTRTKLINLYKAEMEDNKLIREGKIKQEDRRVKIAITDFADPGDHGDDMGLGGHLHFVKYYDEKQKDGSYTRTYINEHRPILEKTGGILPPKSIRVRTQVFSGSLNERGAEKLLIPDVIEIVWGKSKEDPKTFYPYFYRQHWYNEFDPKIQSNPISNTEFFLSSPTSCINCHLSDSNITQKTFLKSGEKRTNFGAITPDSEFEKSISEQRGFKILKTHLDELVKHKKITQDNRDLILRDLQDPTNFENPNIVPALEKYEILPWVQEDEELKKGEDVPEIYKYEWASKLWKNGGYIHYRNLGTLEGLGQRWGIEDLQITPPKRSK